MSIFERGFFCIGSLEEESIFEDISAYQYTFRNKENHYTKATEDVRHKIGSYTLNKIY